MSGARRWRMVGIIGGLLGCAGLLGAVILAGGGASGGSSDATDEVSPGADLDFRPSDADHRKMAALVAGLSPERPHFSEDEARHKPNAKLFTYLAATSEERRVVAASLRAISAAYSSRSSLKETPDADLDRVLLKHLASDDPALVLQALDAARIPLMMESPSPALTDAFVRMAAPDHPPARRHAAIEALHLLPPRARPPQVIDALVTTTEAAEAHLASAALLALEQSEPSLLSSAARQRIGARIADLTNHSDPGVRGRALGLLAKFDGLVAPAERVELLRAALEAEEPYVRAAAADTAGRIGATEVIPRLLALTEDLAVARYDLTGWTNLGGEPGRLLHAVPGRQLVAEAALHALATLSRGELVLAMSGPRQSPEEIRINAERARAWSLARAAD